MAKVNPFPLQQNLNILFRSRNSCSISSKNRNLVKITPLTHTRNSMPLSEFNFDLKNKEVHFVKSSLPLLVGFSRPCLIPKRRSISPSFWVRMMSQSDGATNQLESTKTVKCVIKGRVQGVFYRNWTVENASQLGLKGWVRNRRDGSVEALFSGKPESVDEMQQRCRRGPPDAMVTGFEAIPCNDDPGTGFERKPTV